jgi:glycolate oxidase FAD binding subunit
VTRAAAAYAALGAEVRDAHTVVAVGTGTHAEIGGPVHGAHEVRAPAGIVALEPADMTVTVRAGTTCTDLTAALAEHGQECGLDPRDPSATVGGTLAAGLSGLRRLGVGPLRDTVLEVVLVLADGRVVRGGGPTVKNVTGYDVPRLLVGSLGTLGVLAQVTLRTRPRPRASAWYASDRAPAALGDGLFAPMAILSGPGGSRVWLQGHPDDLAREVAASGLVEAPAVTAPSGAHRGRISVPPGTIGPLSDALRALPGTTWLAEHGVGTVHVATQDPDLLAVAREIADHHGGWLLREAGAPDLDPFGVEPPAAALQRRIRTALDPTGKLAPGRVPATEPGPVPA